MSEKIVLTPEMIDKWLKELPEMEQQIWADHSLPQTFKLALTVVFSVCIAALEEVVELRKSQPTQRALDGARFCPACHALLEEGSVYCDTCGTDTPRQ